VRLLLDDQSVKLQQLSDKLVKCAANQHAACLGLSQPPDNKKAADQLVAAFR